MKPGTGNGMGGFKIAQDDLGGWVRVYLDEGLAPDDLPFYLSHTLTHWFRQRPHLRMRQVVAITRDGATVELHAWYEQVQFPDVSPLASRPTKQPEQ